jgi:PIN domain nuclease of toxin-antitoxin system
VRLLLDTHLLLWAAGTPARLSAAARKAINSLGRSDFAVNARLLRRGLLDNGYAEIAISGEHALAVDSLPAIHKDPFDRMLLAQATTEGMTLLTADATLAQYPGSIRKV